MCMNNNEAHCTTYQQHSSVYTCTNTHSFTFNFTQTHTLPYKNIHSAIQTHTLSHTKTHTLPYKNTHTFARSMRRILKAKLIVTAKGSPSGTATTTSVRANRKYPRGPSVRSPKGTPLCAIHHLMLGVAWCVCVEMETHMVRCNAAPCDTMHVRLASDGHRDCAELMYVHMQYTSIRTRTEWSYIHKHS